MRLLELGNLVKARLDVRDAALAPMRELHKLTHQPVNLSMRQGDEIVYIERTYSERSGMQVVRAIGGRAPLHLTSVGKLFLAMDDPQTVRAYATRTGLAGHTRNSITDAAGAGARTGQRAQAGHRHATTRSWSWACAAWRPASYDDQGKLIAGLSISAPADRLEEAWLDRRQGHGRADLSGARATAPLKHWAAPASGAGLERRVVAACAARRRAPSWSSHWRTRSASPMREYLPGRIQEHHDQLAPGQLGLHHQAAPGLGDVAGLLQADVPGRGCSPVDWCCGTAAGGCRCPPAPRARSTVRG